MTGRNLVDEVTCQAAYTWSQDISGADVATDDRPHVVVIDCGVKYNILRNLVGQGFQVTVVPASTTSHEIMALQPDGILVSNGPGDPEVVGTTIGTLKEIIGKLPVMGICLGHQLLSLALGPRHINQICYHGANHPVKNLLTGKIELLDEPWFWRLMLHHYKI
ncbi:MAG: hypothetical protein R3A45_11325 [Bdellovibrionota bacterium]